MKICMFRHRDSERLGIVEGDEVIDVLSDTDALSRELQDWLPNGQASWRILETLAHEDKPRLRLSDVGLLPPIRKPGKFLAIGGNYRTHLQEIAHLKIPIGEHQIWFNKQTSCIAGPFDDLRMPAVSDTLDYEIELAVVIGKRCSNVKAQNASSYIAGYMVSNDATIRAWQSRTQTITLSKSFDTLGPIGPWLVTADEIPDPQELWLKTWVNDELRQDGNTNDMRFKISEQIEELSTAMTLMPGDILATGTPAGVGFARIPARYLSRGDVVTMEIQGLGQIRNKVV